MGLRPKNEGYPGVTQVWRLMLIVPIGLPSFPRYSRTTTTPWSMSGRKSGFVQLAFFITGVNFVPNVMVLMPSASGFMSVYMEVSLSPGPALAPSSLVFESMLAGAAWLACPAISASLFWSSMTEFDGVEPLGFTVWGSFTPHAANAANTTPKYAGCFLYFTRVSPGPVDIHSTVATGEALPVSRLWPPQTDL
jgi:hypothetical protein